MLQGGTGLGWSRRVNCVGKPGKVGMEGGQWEKSQEIGVGVQQ